MMGFEGTSGYVASLFGVSSPMLGMLLALVVIVIEVPVALAYAWGYRVCYTGGALVAFTVLATLLVHRNIADPMQLVMALKNVAIIGGILATTSVCSCTRCTVTSTS